MSGKSSQANELSEKIGTLIRASNAVSFSALNHTTPKALWSGINRSLKPASSGNQFADSIPTDVFNRFFASNSYDATRPMEFTVTLPSLITRTNQCSELQPIDELMVERQLRTMKHSSPGADLIPSWVFRQCSFELASPVTVLLNTTFAEGRVPQEWHSAIITPVPKIQKPASISDFRPISVTSLLSRLAERMLIQNYLQPCVSAELMEDQFAFRATGSTTAALTCLLHKVTKSHINLCKETAFIT